jgi:hypothetical protein
VGVGCLGSFEGGPGRQELGFGTGRADGGRGQGRPDFRACPRARGTFFSLGAH